MTRRTRKKEKEQLKFDNYKYYLHLTLAKLQEEYVEWLQDRNKPDQEEGDAAFALGVTKAYEDGLTLLKNKAIAFQIPLKELRNDLEKVLACPTPDIMTYQNYIIAVILALKAKYKETFLIEKAEKKRNKDNLVIAGNVFGYYLLLERFRSEAISFFLPLKKIALGEPIPIM